MSEATLELMQAKQAELATLLLVLPEAHIELQPGEHYAGAVLDHSGRIVHHLVLMAARPDGYLQWQAALDWAAAAGGALPTRQEQALLFANCKPHLDATWHWSCEPEGASFAWFCGFNYGGQNYGDRSAEGSAVAVRRLMA